MREELRCDVPRDLVHPVRRDPAGVTGPTRGQARGGRWRRTSLGLYVPSDTDRTRVEQRIAEEAARLGPDGAVTGWAALRLAGAAYFDGLDPSDLTALAVPLVVGSGQLRRAAGIQVMRDELAQDEVVLRAGIRCTNVERATFDAMRHAADERAATVAMDMVAAADLTSIRRMRAYVEQRAGQHGVPRVRRGLDLADEDSWSPKESEMRLVWMLDAGFPKPLCNRSVHDRHGRLLGVADLLDPEAGVVGEYDGGDHAGKRRRRRDARREDDFRSVGLECFKIVTGDLDDIGLVVDRMTRARSRARWLPPVQRRWTVGHDSEDDPSESLDFRLDRRDMLRELHERDGWT